MSNAHQSQHGNSIPQVGWHDQRVHSRPGMLHPLPLPLHPEAPAIPGGLPGIIPGRSAVVSAGPSSVAHSGSNLEPHSHVLTNQLVGVHHLVYTPSADFIPGRSGIAPFMPNKPVRQPILPVHVPRPVHR